MAEFAVIFDWDGVVIDSSAQHKHAWEVLAAERGLPLDEDHFLRGFGKRNETIIPDLGWATEATVVHELGLRKEALYRELLAASGSEALPGARRLVEGLIAGEVPVAIGSSTHRANLEAALDLLDLRAAFPVIVSGEDVKEGKPNPEVFLLASERLGVPAARCVVIEDSPSGIEAARNGGIAAVAVLTSHPAGKFALADLVVPDLEVLTVGMLRSLALRKASAAEGS